MKIIQYKICLLGDFAVGKTSLVRRYVEGRFDDRYLSTIGVKVSRKSLDREDTKFHLLIWDLAGEDRFARYQEGYLSGAVGAMVVADLTRHATLEHLPDYAAQIRGVEPGASILIVGNKSDLVNEREISNEEFQKTSQMLQAPWLLASAKTGEQVDALFQAMLELIHTQPDSHGA